VFWRGHYNPLSIINQLISHLNASE
jgi:hypothetical protein